MRFPGALLSTAVLALALPAAAIDFHDVRSLAAAALENNPTILRLQAEVDAARERARSASAQPNPMLMAGVQDKQIDLSDDEMMTMYMVGAQQTFTSGDKRRARRSIAELQARAMEQSIVTARAEIERDVLLAWYDAASADSQISASEQVRALVEAIIGAARIRYEVGDAIQADVIRAQLEKSNLEHEILTLTGVREAAVARLLSLLDLPAETSVPRLHLPHESAREEIDRARTPSPDHPALAAVQAEMASQEEAIRLARLASRPDIGLEASYGYRRTEMDMFSVVATIELPVRRGSTIEPQIREAVATRESARLRLAEIRRALNGALAVAFAVHRQANEQLRLHEQVLVPQARLAFESTLTAYQSGKASFDSVLAAESTYLRLQLDYYQYLAQHIKAIVDFEAIHKGATAAAVAPSAARASGASPGATATTSSMGGM
ncbi:MAG TPA: TolC family protein [Thermoanaerobaculia bacterium]